MTSADVTPAAELDRALDPHTRALLERRRRSRVGRHGRGWLVRRALATADAAGLTLAFFLAVWLFGTDVAAGMVDRVVPRLEAALFLATLPGWIVVAKMYGLYDRDEERTDHSTADEFMNVFHMVTVGAWVLFAGSWLTGVVQPQLDKLIGFWALAILFVCTFRAAARAWCRRHPAYLQNTVIVGAGDVGRLIARKYLRHPEYGINLVGFVDSHAEGPQARALDHLTLLGPSNQLPALIPLLDVERVVIAFPDDDHVQTLELVRALKDLDVQIDIVPRMFEIVGPSAGIHEVEGLPIMSLPPLRLGRSSLLLKRGMDILVSFAALVALSPLLVALGLLVRLDGRGPILYRSDRVGRRGRRFELLKFRTMRPELCRGRAYGSNEAEAAFEALMADPALREEFQRTHKLAADPRVTRIGRFLRRTSLDELPQLLNVLLGDISLVGPRPITSDEYRDVELTPAAELGYWASTNLRPGVTGYWQINGRSSTSYEERLRLDLAYVTHWSLGLDLAIIAKTGRALMSRTGAS